MLNHKIKCVICEDINEGKSKEFKNNNSYIGSHVKRVHNLLLEDYVVKYYQDVTLNFKKESCGFCERDAIIFYDIDHIKKQYIKSYIHSHSKVKYYFCGTEECKNKISLKFLKKPYNKKTYEHIGSVSEYISKLRKIDIDQVNKSKSKGFRNMKNKLIYNLEGYINWYGEVEGKKRYYKARKNSSRTFSKEEHIKKYGEDSWLKFRKRVRKKAGKIKISSGNLRIKKILDKHNYNYDLEYPVKPKNEKSMHYSLDFYLKDLNIVIEYYGVYWHASPRIYERLYYNKVMKKYAYQIWEKDSKRISEVSEYFNNNVTIFIIWEDTKKTDEQILKIIEDNKNNKTIIEIR